MATGGSLTRSGSGHHYDDNNQHANQYATNTYTKTSPVACIVSYVHRPVAASPPTVGRSGGSLRLSTVIGPGRVALCLALKIGIAKATEVLSALVARQALVEPVDCWPVAIVIRTHLGASPGR
jgi:hypothetical protein